VLQQIDDSQLLTESKMNLHQSLLSLFICLASALVSLAQQELSAPATDIATQETITQFESYVETARQQWQVPGLAIAIVKDDQVLLSKGFGNRRSGSVETVDQHTLFAIASNSKAFTSAALAILVDEGKLKWDDRVSQHLPWFRLRDDFATREIRVNDLLCHRSGLGTFSGDLLWWGTDYTPKQVLQRAAELELASSFRSAYGYSKLQAFRLKGSNLFYACSRIQRWLRN